MKSETEFLRLGGHLPDEVQMLIKEYAQPRLMHPSHYKSIYMLFQTQKKMMMPIVIGLKYPIEDIFLRSRFNIYFRKSQIEYRKQQIGEIYEELYENELVNTLPPHKQYIINRSQTLKFNGNKLQHISSNSMNCSSVYGEIVSIVILIMLVILPKLIIYPMKEFLRETTEQDIRLEKQVQYLELFMPILPVILLITLFAAHINITITANPHVYDYRLDCIKYCLNEHSMVALWLFISIGYWSI